MENIEYYNITKKPIPDIKIGNVEFGLKKPCVMIAEGCDNHGGSLVKAKELAHAAKESGAHMIKFQLHLPNEEMLKPEMEETSSEMFAKWGSLWGFVEQNLISPDDHYELMRYCRQIGIQYFCTPFSLKAAELLNEMGVEGFKIGSGETEDLPMLEETAKMGKPMMIATGMTRLDEVDNMVEAISPLLGPQLMLAHCISCYSPKTLKELNLGCISMLRERYNLITGLSDHTPPEGAKDASGMLVSEEKLMSAALGQGACFIEKHFTLDRNTPDADSRFSHDPNTLKRLADYVRNFEDALNSERDIFENEKPVWIWAKRSLVSVCDIPTGTKITREMLTSKRPGTGIRSKDYKQIIGKTAKENIPQNTMLKWNMLG